MQPLYYQIVIIRRKEGAFHEAEELKGCSRESCEVGLKKVPAMWSGQAGLKVEVYKFAMMQISGF